MNLQEDFCLVARKFLLNLNLPWCSVNAFPLVLVSVAVKYCITKDYMRIGGQPSLVFCTEEFLFIAFSRILLLGSFVPCGYSPRYLNS